MVYTGNAASEFPYLLLVAMRRVSAPLVAIALLWLISGAYNVSFNESYSALAIIVGLLALIVLPGKPQNGDLLPPKVWTTFFSVATRWCLLVGIMLLLGYATKTSAIFSRKVLFTWFVLTPFLLLPVQMAIDLLISRLLLSAGNVRNVVIAGAGSLGNQLAAKIRSFPRYGLNVVGFFDDRGPDRLSKDASMQMLGSLKDLPSYVTDHRVDLIFVTLPIRNIQRVTDLLDQLHDTTASIYFVPDVFVFDLIQCRTSDLDGLPIVALCETPFQGARGLIKTISDYAIASAVLLVTSPILITIAIAIKLTSRGSIIFKQRRYGLDGHEIIVYKFRTMTVSDDSDVIIQATRDDERLTKIGGFLRKTSLDELPQFINVLQGRMSVVGPRPHAVAHNEEYRTQIKGYMMRHKVNPGITGLAQVLGYRGETKTVEAMQKRVEYDLEYLRNWSLSLDLRIILRTLRTVLSDSAAY